MLIINADDWGRSPADTDAIRDCYEAGRVSSASAMVFMDDSERAAEIANGRGMDVGLHLNFTEEFNGRCAALTKSWQTRTRRFLNASKYALLVYHPLLKREFAELYRVQAEEFVRLYKKEPSHIDGHQHMHLSSNVLLNSLIPYGTKIRRGFSFWPGEKSGLNRRYRRLVDQILAKRYRLTDFFFALSQTLQGDRRERARNLAKEKNVELMTHPRARQEFDFLMSDECRAFLQGLELKGYASL